MNHHSKIVYSTDPEFMPDAEPSPSSAVSPKSLVLRIELDRKQRAGKSVTVVSGFTHSAEDLNTLAKQLKSKCATGGTVKGQSIELQGDHREKAETFFHGLGYKTRRVGG